MSESDDRLVPIIKVIAEYLVKTYHLEPRKARQWARYLRGLEWRWIRPVAQMAVAAHHKHPAAALAFAAATSEDVGFKAAAKRHIERSK